MQAPFRKTTLTATLCLLCAAIPAAHAAIFIKFDGIPVQAPSPGSPEVWRWSVTPLDASGAAGVQVAVGDVTGDGLDPVTMALLLPAVQKVREAAAQWPGPIPLTLTQPLTAGEAALLLPAVQKVREAAAALPSPATASLMDFTTDVDPLSLMLLLPAVQKVREAAMSDQPIPGVPPVSDEFMFSLLVPAAHNANDVAGRIQLANRSLPSLLGLPGSGDANMYFTTGWQLQNGLVTLRMDSAPISVVPEPATWALWLGGLGMAALLQRRRGAVPAAAAA